MQRRSGTTVAVIDPITSFLIVIPAGNDSDLILLNRINQAVCIVNSPRPETCQVLFQRFRFADALKGTALRIKYQLVDAFERFFILALPVHVVSELCQPGIA